MYFNTVFISRLGPQVQELNGLVSPCQGHLFFIIAIHVEKMGDSATWEMDVPTRGYLNFTPVITIPDPLVKPAARNCLGKPSEFFFKTL